MKRDTEIDPRLRSALDKSLSTLGEDIKNTLMRYIIHDRHCTTLEQVEAVLKESLGKGATKIISELHKELNQNEIS